MLGSSALLQLVLPKKGGDVGAVTNVMEEMQRRNREMFRVPPDILYVARAFSTLEGSGRTANEDYSLVQEAFPYLSQRLLTDESPRAKAALRSMLYSQGSTTKGEGSLKKFVAGRHFV